MNSDINVRLATSYIDLNLPALLQRPRTQRILRKELPLRERREETLLHIKAKHNQAQQNQAQQNQAYQSQAQQGGAANQQRNTSVNQNASWGKAISSKYNWEPIDESKQPAEGISVKFTPSGVLARYDSDTNLIVPTNPQTVYGISPRNDEQVFAIDALMNQNIRLVY